jgi:hypothetical protein
MRNGRVGKAPGSCSTTTTATLKPTETLDKAIMMPENEDAD